MALEGSSEVKVHQCLFGYEDGHRLLASSLHLGGDTASLLLVLSDLAPGLITGEVDGYWTGIPLSAARYYAFMRTWPAPEVPRPGCVWTHVLLIGFTDIPRLTDLGVLARYATRPTRGQSFHRYAEPISVGDAAPDTRHGDRLGRISREGALRVIKALYGKPAEDTLVDWPGALDATIFAVWSQQWPRLRRSFAFRTATSAFENRIPGTRFDIRVAVDSIGGSSRLRNQHEGASAEAWESVAADDLVDAQPSEFRRFLWRYGSDIRRGRERFGFLATLYQSTRTTRLEGEPLEKTLITVARTLPTPDDGRVLKKDLVAFGRSQYSLLPAADPLDTLAFFIQHPATDGLSVPGDQALQAIHDLWTTRSDEILSIADQAAASGSPLGDAVLDRLARIAEPKTFLASTANRQTLRRHVIASNPALLDSEDLPRVPQPDLSRLLELVPDDERVARLVVQRLLSLNDRQVAGDLSARFPDVTIRATAEAIERAVEGSGSPMADAWLEVVTKNARAFLGSGLVEAAGSTRALAAFAAVLDYDSSDVLGAGPLPWARALRTARDNLDGHRRQVFLAFLMALCLASTTQGCESLFEKTFEPVHAELLRSGLSSDASSILFRHLPAVHWWQQWDSCLRLRLGVVTAYVENDLDPHSFRRLTSDPDLFARLLQLADDTRRGRRFIKNLGATAPLSGGPFGS